MNNDLNRLTTERHWDEIYENQNKFDSPALIKKISLWKRCKLLLKGFLGSKGEKYAEHLLWNGIYPKYLPSQRGLKILEVGSAPGWNLIKFHRRRGYIPYGIEYSPAGAEINRNKFVSVGLGSNNVIQADFFSDDILNKYRGSFDIVISGGFIEHFDNPKQVISRHLDLLASGGTLIITIPNFSGVNYWLGRFLNSEMIKLHNLNIMSRESFLPCFDFENLENFFCGYYGTFYLGLFQTDKTFLKNLIYRFLVRLQVPLNILFYFLFKEKGKENRYFSPYLIYIGRKK